MKRALSIGVIAVALATSFGCSDDDGILVTPPDGGSDASAPSSAGSTSDPTTTGGSSVAPDSSSDVLTSEDNGSIIATLDQSSTFASTDAPSTANGSSSVTDSVVTAESASTSETASTPEGSVTGAHTSDPSIVTVDTSITPIGTADDMSSSVDGNWSLDAGPDSSVTTGVDTSGGDDTATGCTNDDECPLPMNPCMAAMCHDNACMEMPIGEGLEAREQTDGDCKIVRCDGAGSASPHNDDEDVPDDGLDCTMEECQNGEAAFPDAQPGTVCDDGDGELCDGSGNCVECLATGDCGGQDSECSWRTCTDGVCGMANADADTELEAQTAGDCQKVTCGGTVNDDDDTPNDSNPCTTDGCNEGSTSFTDVDPGIGCGTGLICDGSGACVGCLTPNDCPGADDECQARTCSPQGTCGYAFTAQGTPVAAQTDDDCRENVCDGSGGTTWQNDANDAPVDPDGCSTVSCDNGTAIYSSQGTTVRCGVGDAFYCDGNGSCVECNAASQCGTDTFCRSYTCHSNTCGFSNTEAGEVAPSQSPGDCKENQCDGSGNIVSVNQNADVPVDGNECTLDQCNSGTASNPVANSGDSCTQGGAVCDGAGLCVECNQGTDCASGVCNNHECTCTSNDDCESGMCYESACVDSINGCNIATASDLGAGPVTITFANGNLTYAPKCIKVEQGASVTFNGSFASHPMTGGAVVDGTATAASSGPFVPATTSGTTKTVTMSDQGTFPYYCVPHGPALNMNAVVFVVPSQGG